MKKQLTLIYLKQTGNVLAAVTRAAQPTPPAATGDNAEEQQKEFDAQELVALVGQQLPVRHLGATSDAEYTVTADNLAVHTRDFDANMLKNPRAFFFNATEKQIRPLPPDAVTVAITRTAVTVTLPANVAVKTEVWVQVEADGTGEPKSQVVAGAIDVTDPVKDEKTLTLQSLADGDYVALVLVTGYLPAEESQSFP